MANTKITKTMIRQQIVKNLQKDNVYVTRLGKQIIPQNENDLPPRMKKAVTLGKTNREYNKAHGQLYYKFVTKPSQVKKVAKKLAPIPLVLAETPKDNPMKEYREVARKGRINAKKLVVNLSPTMTCTIEENGLITVDFN